MVLVMRIACLFALWFGLATSAAAQDAPPAAEPRSGADVEELIVPGRAPANLRLEIQRLETAVYDRFNALNGNDDFDIHCFERAPTGSNIPLRTCAPNFVIEAEARAARNMLKDGRGSNANNFNRAELNLSMEQKSRELTEEMQRVAREDEQLLRDLARLAELRQLQLGDAEQPPGR